MTRVGNTTQNRHIRPNRQGSTHSQKKKKKNLLQYDHAATSSSTCLSQKVLGCMTRKKKLFSKKQSQHVNATE